MTAVVWGGWGDAVRDDPFPAFHEARRRGPVQQVRLADGHAAWVVLGYGAARQALGEQRLSKDMVAALDQEPEVVSQGAARPRVRSRHAGGWTRPTTGASGASSHHVGPSGASQALVG